MYYQGGSPRQLSKPGRAQVPKERYQLGDTITKLPESGDLCGNITEFGVAEGDPLPPQTK